MSRERARFLILVSSGIGGMVLLGMVAAVAVTVREKWRFQFEYFLAASFIAGIAGVFSLLWIVIWLDKSRLAQSLPFVYGVSALPTAIWAWLDVMTAGLTAVVPAIFSVIITTAIASALFRDPRRASFSENLCPKCAYSLCGQMIPACPECGRGRDQLSGGSTGC